MENISTKVKSKETKIRIFTSLVIILIISPLIILLGFKPTIDSQIFDYVVMGLFSLSMVGVFYEITKSFFVKEKGTSIQYWIGFPMFIFASLIFISTSTTTMVLFVQKGEGLFRNNPDLMIPLIVGSVIGFLILIVTSTLSIAETQRVMTLFIIQAMFALYVTMLFITTSLLMWNITIMLITGIMISDTMSYFGGKKFGRVKAVTYISPNKTVEGYLIGFVSTIIVTTTLYFTLVNIYPLNQDVFMRFNISTGIFISVLIAIIAPLGDLFFSKTKRSLGIKDFGNSLPGHGGVLDRLDSHIFAFTITSMILLVIYLVV